MGPIQNLQEIFSWLRRRWRPMAIFLLLGAVAGVMMAINSPRIYSANAVIQITNPVIAVDAAGAPDVTRRVQTIEQRLMSREALLALAARYHLFDGQAIGQNEQVALMRQSFSITSIAAAQQGPARDGSLSAVIVSASDDDPEVAAAIANELAEAVVRESDSARQSNAQQTLEFFRAEEDRLQAAIDGLESEIATFRSEHEAYLTDAIAQLRDEQARLAEDLLGLQQQVSAKRNELAALDATSGRAVTQRRMAELSDEINQLTQQAGVLSARIGEIQGVLRSAPGYQQQLIAMDRRMEQLQAQLTAAADRRREAELGARIEDDQQAERFVLLERAVASDQPVSRSRTKIAAVGVIGGLMAGMALAYALEWMNPVMRTAARMERDLRLRPVISIPYTTPASERKRRSRIWAFGLLVLAVALFGLARMMGLI